MYYGWSTSILYDFSLSIELVCRVYRPNMKKYLFPLWMYHVAFQSFGITCAVLHYVIEGTPPWTDVYGCTLQNTGFVR